MHWYGFSPVYPVYNWESLITLGAFLWFISNVCPHVSCKTSVVLEKLITLSKLVWFLSNVCLPICYKMITHWVRLITLIQSNQHNWPILLPKQSTFRPDITDSPALWMLWFWRQPWFMIEKWTKPKWFLSNMCSLILYKRSVTITSLIWFLASMLLHMDFKITIMIHVNKFCHKGCNNIVTSNISLLAWFIKLILCDKSLPQWLHWYGPSPGFPYMGMYTRMARCQKGHIEQCCHVILH